MEEVTRGEHCELVHFDSDNCNNNNNNRNNSNPNNSNPNNSNLNCNNDNQSTTTTIANPPPPLFPSSLHAHLWKSNVAHGSEEPRNVVDVTEVQAALLRIRTIGEAGGGWSVSVSECVCVSV